MAKIKEVRHIYEGKEWHHRQFEYMCAGCGYTHVFGLRSEGGHHDFDMNLSSPTISPSLLQNFGGESKLCHSFIRNGMIQYLNDCQHHLAGKTIELPEIN